MASLIPAIGSCLSRMTGGEKRLARRLEDIADATGRGGSLERRFARRPYFVAGVGGAVFPWQWSAGTPGALGTWIA